MAAIRAHRGAVPAAVRRTRGPSPAELEPTPRRSTVRLGAATGPLHPQGRIEAT